jgi:hypothetical protein
VLITNYRDFVLVAQDVATGKPVKRETFRLSSSDRAFWAAAAQLKKLVASQGDRFVEYLKRVMLHAAPLSDPKDVAWFLASYARDAKARLANADPAALASLRAALEQALGLTFTGEEGDHFFRSTLVQTLFYGVFSAWVLWNRTHPSPGDRFDRDKTTKYLHVPILRKLFHEVSAPGHLEEWHPEEVLDWTASFLETQVTCSDQLSCSSASSIREAAGGGRSMLMSVCVEIFASSSLRMSFSSTFALP